jgi:hypothetical protein
MWYQYYDFFREASWIIHDDTWSTFQQRWSRFSTVTNEIKQLIPMLLNGQEVIPSSDVPFIQRAISYNNILYLIAANGIDSSAISGDVTIPITSWSLSDAAVLYGNAAISKNGGALHIILEPNTGAIITIGGTAVVSAFKNSPIGENYKTESGRKTGGEFIDLTGRISRKTASIYRDIIPGRRLFFAR